MCNHPNREAAMVDICWDENGTPTVWCDPCLAPLVAALNASGIATVASCCGHGYRPGRISLTDGRHLVLLANDAEMRRAEASWPLDVNGDPIAPAPQDLAENERLRVVIEKCDSALRDRPMQEFTTAAQRRRAAAIDACRAVLAENEETPDATTD